MIGRKELTKISERKTKKLYVRPIFKFIKFNKGYNVIRSWCFS